MNSRSALVALAVSVMAVSSAFADQRLDFNKDMNEGAIFALASMLAASGASELNFVSAEADLNGDGRMDVVAFAEVSYFCGSGGCSPTLLVASKKGWNEIPFNGLSAPENWYLLDSSTNGFRKIAVLRDDNEEIYEWDGSAYVRAD